MKLTLKKRAAVSISLTYSFIFGVTSITIWLLFASYREDEFKIRLEEKALTNLRLLVEVDDINDQLRRTIERSSLNRLYKEKTVIYNSTGNSVYSTTKLKSIILDNFEMNVGEINDLIKEQDLIRELPNGIMNSPWLVIKENSEFRVI